jgi:predicted metallopeptidase
MAKDWQVCPETRELSEKIIEKFSQTFAHIDVDKISFIIAMDGKAPNKGRTLAKIRIINEKTRIATGTPYNYMLEVYDSNWADQEYRQKQMIIFHELMHIDSAAEEDDPQLRKHNMEDFYEILDVWGIDYLYDDELPNLLDENLKEEDYGLKI